MFAPAWLVGTLVLAAAAATQTLPAAASGASDGQQTALLDKLVLAGDASSDIEEVVHRAVLRGLTREGVRVIEPPQGSAAAPCTNASCAASRASAGGAGFLVGGKVLVAERNYEVTLELHDGRDGRTLATRTASCPICSVPEVEAAAESAAADLASAVTAPAQPLAITSEPAGALVYVDGALAGTTPFSQPIGPGEHRVELKKEGYLEQGRTITVEPGSTPGALAFSLLPRKTHAPLSPIGWMLVGLGGAGFVTGVALLAVDERPYKGLCDGEYMDSFGRCRFQYNTLGGGVAGVVAGAALLGGGAALLVLDRKRRKPGPGASARLRLDVHPRGVTLSGRF